MTQAIVEPGCSLGALADYRVLGLNYRTAGLAVRSALSFDQPGIEALLDNLRDRGLVEALVLCTCNRTEVYFTGSEPEVVLAALSEMGEVPLETLESASYKLRGREAVNQLFRVACGLDSAVLGEHEILKQIKTAENLAKEGCMIGKRLGPLVQRALRVSKRVRTESGLNREVISVGSMALRQASNLAGALSGKKILLIGAGQIAERMAKDLSHVPHGMVWVCNRTPEKAERLASLFGLSQRSYSDLDPALEAADIVICAVSAPTPILSEERLERARNGRPVVVVDLGMPPNFTPNHAHGIARLVNMEAIGRACEENSKSRAAAVPHASSIVDEEVAVFEREALEREGAPIIEALTELAEEVRKRNLDWALAQNPSASATERKLLEDLSIRIVRGMLEVPIHALKHELREPVERAVLARLYAVEAP